MGRPVIHTQPPQLGEAGRWVEYTSIPRNLAGGPPHPAWTLSTGRYQVVNGDMCIVHLDFHGYTQGVASALRHTLPLPAYWSPNALSAEIWDHLGFVWLGTTKILYSAYTNNGGLPADPWEFELRNTVNNVTLANVPVAGATCQLWGHLIYRIASPTQTPRRP